MKIVNTLGLALCLAAGVVYADSWNAKVIDAACYDQAKVDKSHNNDACNPTAATTNFAIRLTGGKVYKVDAASNAKLASDFKSGALKPDSDGDIHGEITGKLKDGIVSVNSVVVQH